jgi:HD-like signal output (HDOD) protein
MPEVGLALIRTLDNENVEAAEVQALIARDPALTVRLIALANSASFGLPRKVATLDSAMQLVGMSRIRTMALSACLHNAFSLPAGIDGTDFWRYSAACAGYAQWLAGEPQADMDTQKAWLSGMMLRLGEATLGHARPAALARFEQPGQTSAMRWDLQRELVGVDEAAVTAEIARRWNFPPDIILGLRLAGRPLAADPRNRLAGILHLAGLLADVPDADAKALDALPVAVMDALGLRFGWMQSTFPDAGGFVGIAA